MADTQGDEAMTPPDTATLLAFVREQEKWLQDNALLYPDSPSAPAFKSDANLYAALAARLEQGEEVAALKADLRVNAQMLAQQCDLARVAETKAERLAEALCNLERYLTEWVLPDPARSDRTLRDLRDAARAALADTEER